MACNFYSKMTIRLIILLIGVLVPVCEPRGAFGATSAATLAPDEGDGTDLPFYKPQTNFVFGQFGTNFSLSQNGSTRQFNLNQGNFLSTFGFDIELNQFRFMNIGATARFSSVSGLIDSSLPSIGPNVIAESMCMLGGFVRFFYVPPFLSGRSMSTNVFGRFDLGGGPVFLPAQLSVFGGVLGHTGLHFGVETYFSKWFGLGLSYGQIYQWGAVTSGVSGSIFNQGSETVVSLKTTLF